MDGVKQQDSTPQNDSTLGTRDDDFILILITCKYTHFWDFTVNTNNFVTLENVTNT
jgi:hypothetical protein